MYHFPAGGIVRLLPLAVDSSSRVTVFIDSLWLPSLLLSPIFKCNGIYHGDSFPMLDCHQDMGSKTLVKRDSLVT